MSDLNFTGVAHDDHGLSDEHVDFIMRASELREGASEGDFVLRVLALPDGLESLPCALYGPTVGDEVGDGCVIIDDDTGGVPSGLTSRLREEPCFEEVRGGRQGPSRLVDLPTRPARNVVVIGILGGICFTAYGTRASEPSPMEPWDARRKGLDAEEVERCDGFWAAHALSSR